ncbi:protein kinase [Actinomadura sp. DC4]|uniref:serine/threonine protein kinase n=1 Tax=Actinomadura sp. DC4 TaxID=3055069 RepID=UPI0025AF13F6|nr:protein kinase [Actinomadura sp. DC4]MDN3352070.1 protein kinase [Actinomadura sp. DC4]
MSAPKALGGEVLPPGAEPLQADDPAVIDGHRLTGRLAAGGTSVVYLAHAPGGEHVVVKTTRMRRADQTQTRRRLRTEAVSVRRLPAFCTPALRVDGSDESPPYLIQDYVEGPSLAQFVEGLGPLDPEQLDALAIALARALGAVHGAGLIHCDVEPTNVLLASDGPRLIDFSIAQEAPISGRPAEIGTVPYNPGWVSPERVSGHPAGTASDVFGWGCLLGYAATGRSPISEEGTGVRADVLDALQEPLRGLVSATLAEDPADRPTVGELLGRLDGTAERVTPVPRPLTRRQDLEGAPEAVVDAPTAPMPALAPMPAEPMLALDAPAALDAAGPHRSRPQSLRDHAAETGAELLPWHEQAEEAPASRRVEYAAETAKAATADPPPRRVEYAAETASRRRAEDERRPRRLRMVAMVTAPAALVAVLATVVAMAATGNGGSVPAEPGSALVPGQGPVDSQAPEDHDRHSYGPRPASASRPHDHTSPTAAEPTRRTLRKTSRAPSRPGGGSHSPSSPTHAPPPPPTHSPTPSPSPTPTGTGAATG